MANIIDKNTPELISFITGCQEIINKGFERYENVDAPSLSHNNGRRYYRIERKDANGAQTSVHCFIDRTNGDVLKAAGWKGPAKTARGNIFSEDNGLNCMGEFGAAYLRR